MYRLTKSLPISKQPQLGYASRSPSNLRKPNPFRDRPFRRKLKPEDLLRWRCPWKWSNQKFRQVYHRSPCHLIVIWGYTPLKQTHMIFLLADCRPISTQHDRPHFRRPNAGTAALLLENGTNSRWANRADVERMRIFTTNRNGCANKDRDIHAVAAVYIVNEGESNVLLFDIEITPLCIILLIWVPATEIEMGPPPIPWVLCVYIYILCLCSSLCKLNFLFKQT